MQGGVRSAPVPVPIPIPSSSPTPLLRKIHFRTGDVALVMPTSLDDKNASRYGTPGSMPGGTLDRARSRAPTCETC